MILFNNKKSILIVSSGFLGAILLACYVENLLFGINSYEVYSDLSVRKQKLQYKIKYLQKENAKLQKQYLELKNLEPEISGW